MIKAMLTKEFLLVLRDRQALAALFVMPAVFILIMSLALKDVFNDQRTLVRSAVVDLDHSGPSAKLSSLLGENRLLGRPRPPKADGASGGSPLADGTQFVLTVPRGFGKRITASASPPPLLIDVSPEVKPDLLALFKGEVTAALFRLRLETLAREVALTAPEIMPYLASLREKPSAMLRVRFGAAHAQRHPNSVQQSVPAWIVFGMFFVIIPMSTIFINERKQHTLMRLQAMNVSMPLQFAGKIIPYLVINQLQVWVMIAVGMFVVPRFGADALTLGNSVPGLILISLALSLAAVGLSLLIAVLVESVEQATTIGGIVNILLGAIGGVMVPKFVMPPLMQRLTVLSPMSWGLEGFLDIFLRGQGIEAVWGKALALVVFAGLSLGAAALVFSRKKRWEG